jgi:hypothetical protein
MKPVAVSTISNYLAFANWNDPNNKGDVFYSKADWDDDIGAGGASVGFINIGVGTIPAIEQQVLTAGVQGKTNV